MDFRNIDLLRFSRHTLLILALSLAPISNSIAEKRDLASCITRRLMLLAPPSDTLEVKATNPKIIQRLTPSEKKILEPQFEAKVEHSGPLSFNVQSFDDFYLHQLPTLKDKGFFTIFIPSGESDPIKAGHLMVFAKDALFDRNLEEQGAIALRSTPITELSTMSSHFPYAVAQFYETSPNSVELLSRFFHDRTWLYHTGSPDYLTHYVGTPISKASGDVKAENCNTFIFSFMLPYWQNLRPEMETLKNEIGSMIVDQAPSSQIFQNTKSPSFRGTILLSHDPEKLIPLLKKDGMRNDPFGAQLRLDGAITPTH